MIYHLLFSPQISRLRGTKLRLLCHAFIVIVFFATYAAAAACTPGPQNMTVRICTPAPRAIVQTPAHITAAGNDASAVTALQIYIDSALVYQIDNVTSLDTYVPLSLGNHLLTVQAWDSTGATFKTNEYIEQSPPCALNVSNQSITICTPLPSGVTVSSPVHLVAGFTDSSPVNLIKVKEGSQTLATVYMPPLDVYLGTMAAGTHSLTITATDQAGASFSTGFSVNVTDNSGLSNIRHIIYLVQENRSFDDYFGMLGPYMASEGFGNDVDGIPAGVMLPDTKGTLVAPYHYQTVCTDNLTPFWDSSWADWNGGKMDQFLAQSTAAYAANDPTGTRAIGYYDQTDLPYYYELATQMATSDRFFAPVMTNTIGNRMYLFAGTSFGHIRPDTPPAGGWTQTTIFDNLDTANVSWRYYYQDSGSYLPEWSTYQRDSGKMFDISQYYTDIADDATLPSVLFIERGGPSGLDEHPGNNIQLGAQDVAAMINALMASPSWSSSVFILTYDEAGGLYDHVLPALQIAPDAVKPMLLSGDYKGDFKHSGFRVPITVISPWIKPHTVSHVWRDLTSILRLIGVRFGVTALTARDANADDMMEFFDFSSQAWATPPALPVQPTTGICDPTKEKAPGF